MTENLFFAHANSFPATVYHKMLSALSTHYAISYIDCIGHDPSYPITDCWPRLVDEMVASIERQEGGSPVWAVGHSLGGILILYAAIQHPTLFKGLAVLDAPLFSNWRAHFIWLAKRTGFINRLTPGGNTLKRRNSWASIEMVHEYFSRKPLFARFDPDCLWDYAHYGTVDDGQGGRRLKFHPENEHLIYATLPHDTNRVVCQNNVPGLYLAASNKPVLPPHDLHFVRHHAGLAIDRQLGSHLFPLEYPLQTAQRICQAFSDIAGGYPLKEH